MKTRSQSNVSKQRLFLITEYGGGNGWVISAVSPLEARNHFQSEILRLEPERLVQDLDHSWDDYLALEQKTSPSTMAKPCYMFQFHIGKKPYYIETLTFPSQHAAWIPASFN